MQRDVPTDALIQALLPFFATRILYVGAGKVGVENDSATRNVDYQLSQRADFFAVEASVDTLHNRPLVNTRDEPHAAPRRYRRLHVISGDANMSEYATALKVGTMALVLRLLEDGLRSPVRLVDPVKAIKQISRDLTLRQKIERIGGPPLTALEVQRIYFDEAHQRYQGQDEDTDWTLNEWGATLDALETDPFSLADRLDWAAKFALLDAFRTEEKLGWDDPYLQSLDLAYHDVNPEAGLYYGLEQSGEMRRLVTDARIQAAMSCPPADTRALIRGTFAEKFGSAVRAIGWNGVAFRHQNEDFLFDMNSLVEDNLEAFNEEVASAETLDQIIEIIRKRPSEWM
jgi:proteasome accessory factor A